MKLPRGWYASPCGIVAQTQLLLHVNALFATSLVYIGRNSLNISGRIYCKGIVYYHLFINPLSHIIASISIIVCRILKYS